MELHEYFSTSKADEVRAMRRQHSIHNLKTFMHVSEFVLGLMILLTWNSTGLAVAVGATGNCLCHVSSLFGRPISVFLISNGIVAAVSVLSSGKGPDKIGDCSDLYDDEYVSHGGHPAGGVSPLPPEVDVYHSAPAERQAVLLSQQAQQGPVCQDTERTVVTVGEVEQVEPANVGEPRGGCRNGRVMIVAKRQLACEKNRKEAGGAESADLWRT
ncbi:hypothetical protein CDL15_Pgr006892 [Punica granatum]|uniref:Uncharacterized protein n=1 Tax=Punica granatum TaxID=22663 RepID=A0A218X8M1_PUNGR|nr:hypothetical protein CDL15_Pgr006892 [Punica granatum]PKI35158.1 hypothetical protein CRG98_044433 [Punica granatum]